MRPPQNPVVPLLEGGLVVVAVVALLSIIAWVWAVRRPAPTAGAVGSDDPTMPTGPTVAAIVGCDLPGLTTQSTQNSWLDLISARVLEGTRFLRLGWDGMTLAEANRVEIPAAVEAAPDIVLLWSVANDVRKGITLANYSNELAVALATIIKGTGALVLLPNLPDVSLLAQDATAEKRVLIRGGVEQWNRATAEAAARYGKRVRLIDLYPHSVDILDVSSGGRALAELVWPHWTNWK